MDTILIALIVVALIGVALVAFVLSRLETPRAGEILVVTGGPNGPEMHTSRVFVLPFVRRVQSLPVGVQKTEINLPETMTSQGVPLKVDAVVAFKIDTDPAVVGNAIERFADAVAQMPEFVHTVFAGHLRAIVGSMTAQQVTTGRDELAKAVREASTTEMSNLGLRIDSVQIRDVEDAAESQYLRAWRQKEQSGMVAEARVAEAAANQTAVQAEQEAEARNAERTAAAEIRSAEVAAEAAAAKAKADQAGPLAEAQARRAVIAAETEAAELEAALTEKKLTVEITRPAEAQRDAQIATAEGEARAQVLAAEAEKTRVELAAAAAKTQVTLAAEAEAAAVKLDGNAQAESTRVRGEAQAAATQATGLAEAKAIEARGAAFEKNADAVIQQSVAERLPEIIAAASAPIAGIENLTVMDIKSLQEIPGGNLAAGLSLVPKIMESLGGIQTTHTNGVAPGTTQRKPTTQERSGA